MSTDLTTDLSPAEARDSVERTKRGLAAAGEEIVRQINGRAWIALGYTSWDEMREAEYGGAAVIVPRADRPQLSARLAAEGLSQQQIGATLGVSQKTVSNDLADVSSFTHIPETRTDALGREQPRIKPRSMESLAQPIPPPPIEFSDDLVASPVQAVREPHSAAPQPVQDQTPRWGAPEARTAEVVRCEAGHIAARSTFEDMDGCPYCLHSAHERQIAIEARELEKRRLLKEAVSEFPELEYYENNPDKAIALAGNLRDFSEPELSMRRENLAKAIIADQRRATTPADTAEPDHGALADRMFVALNEAAQVIARYGGSETFRKAIPVAAPLLVETWRDQCADLARACTEIAEECAPRLRRLK